VHEEDRHGSLELAADRWRMIPLSCETRRLSDTGSTLQPRGGRMSINPKELGLRTLSTHELLRRCVVVAHTIWPRQKVTWQIETNVGTFNFAEVTDVAATETALRELKALAANKDYVICAFVLVRRQGDPAESFRYSTPDGIRASIEIKSSGSGRVAEIVESLSQHFDFVPFTNLFGGVDPASPELAALQLREASVADLHAQLSKLSSLLTTVTERDVELRAKRMAELDAEYRARLANFERERASMLERDEQQRQTKQEELQRREAALQARIEEHDARESKLVRRDLEKELKKLLDDFGKFSLSEDTTKKRIPVTKAVVVMATLFLALAVVAGYAYFTTLNLHYLPATTAGLVGFSATMLFFVKWSDRWFREHADEELQSKRYRADMLRASWIAELAAEWVKDGKDAPPELLEVFARNLFATLPDIGETEHPADALLGLLVRPRGSPS
jgi:hypothetical protein